MAINWYKINSGGCFESLVHALLFAEETDVILFGRPGKDSGQDARSGDGKTVYQAKFRQTNETLTVLATKEFGQIKQYKNPTHQNYVHWKDVTQWVLVSNADVNPNDTSKWNSTVKPLFDKIGLTATYWNRELLEQKLIAQPQIVNVFFEGKNRCFIGLKEAYDFLTADRLGNSYSTKFVGCENELASILTYAETGTNPFYRIVGIGGVGKTRLLYEAALKLSDKGIRVLWGLPESTANSNAWFEFLNDNRRTVVIIDTPTDGSLIKRLLEQTTTSERKNWKFIFAYRPENENFLFGHRLHSYLSDNPLQLTPLDRDEINELSTQKFGDCSITFLDLIFRYSAGNPGWIWMLLDYFSRHDKSLQPTADDITTDYVDSAFQGFSDAEKESAEMLLRWLALWRVTEFAPNDPYGIKQFLENNGVNVNITQLLEKLVAARVVYRFGVGNRKHMVQPMIMREAVLSNWLFVKSGAGDDVKYSVSDAGKKLIQRIISENVLFSDRVLGSLTQLSLSRLNSNERFSLVNPIFDKFDTMLSETDITANDVKRIIKLTLQIGEADLERAIDVLMNVFSLNNVTAYKGEDRLWAKVLTQEF